MELVVRHALDLKGLFPLFIAQVAVEVPLVHRLAVGSVDGRVMIRHEMKGPASDFGIMGRELADHILAQGGRALLDQVYLENRGNS